MNSKRYLIVNADDFGQSHGINQGIIEAHEHGIVSSASLMVRWQAAADAAKYALAHPEFSLGLHIDFGEWAYRDGEWVTLYEVTSLEDPSSVTSEILRQFDQFRALVGRDPTHIDSHQHVHQSEPIHGILAQLAQELSVPLRGTAPAINYIGSFYGQTGNGTPLPHLISTRSLLEILKELPPGVSEMACHPGNAKDFVSMYRNERTEEVRVLCDSTVRNALAVEGIELISYFQIGETCLQERE